MHDDFDYPVKVIYYEGCTQINPYMFISRSMDSYAGSFLCSIDSVILPSSIERIGESAFNNTTFKETNFVIPSGCKEIGDYALISYDLDSVYIPSTVTSIGTEAVRCPSEGVFDIYIELTEEEVNALWGEGWYSSPEYADQSCIHYGYSLDEYTKAIGAVIPEGFTGGTLTAEL